MSGFAAFPVTSQAFFDLQGASLLLRAKPPGFSRNLESWYARGDFADRDFRVHERRERPWNGGTLRTAAASYRAGTGSRQRLSFAFFEHDHGCLALTRRRPLDETVAVFEHVPIDTAAGGISVELPVIPDLRPPVALTYSPQLGQLAIHPLTESVRRALPASPGRRVAHGELYRTSVRSPKVLFVTRTCRVLIVPESRPLDLVHVENVAVDWVKK